MSKDLSIVIPHYKETEQDMFPLLSSISNQVGIGQYDIEVVISNDGGGYGELNKDFLSLFSMPIRQVNLPENRGPGVARQFGLDASRGDYVMFCDADDTLHNVGVLGALIQEVKKEALDILTSQWLEEIIDKEGNPTYLNHGIENTWMHGKLFRRQFLIKNNIRFHDDLRVHEDSYILALTAAMATKNNHLPTVTYVWKFLNDSITRRNEGRYTYDSFSTFIRACTLADHELLKRGITTQLEYKVLQLTCYVYFCLHSRHWLDEAHKEYHDEAEKTFVECIEPFWSYWENATPERIAQVYNEDRARNFNGQIENETIDAWLARIMPKNEPETKEDTSDEKADEAKEVSEEK